VGQVPGHKMRPSQKRREPRCETDTWGTQLRFAQPPIVDKLLDIQEGIYEPVVMSGEVVFFLSGVFGLGMFFDTIVGGTNRCWIAENVA
jgi:hypothetical protein